MFQTNNPKIADAVEAAGEVFEYMPVRPAPPAELVIPVGQVKEEVPA